MTSNLIKNIHEGVDPPSQEGETVLVKGQYDYWHYKCDGVDDRVSYRILAQVKFTSFFKLLNYFYIIGMGLRLPNAANN